MGRSEQKVTFGKKVKKKKKKFYLEEIFFLMFKIKCINSTINKREVDRKESKFKNSKPGL